jgi:hypothetical protein
MSMEPQNFRQNENSAYVACVAIFRAIATDDVPLMWPGASFLLSSLLLAASSVTLWKRYWLWAASLAFLAFVTSIAGMPDR